ncbi:helix-turn-helix domain-containing protein [Dyadobacter frigoris]|uniref:Helix-turn-helix domain-containing protein n=1 Tax=Dyadobacter frigoris TaxID=2576211 RepID=A0A4U6CXW4_9BACT|nr:helix-turn-helix domain-containing protein [Dyadobacter frigoris]TKT86264.1 helix-turn-helix domain-containing protein [Dyadobacter frigoris]GLU56895.1 AraC family transcriptional regulator [Dyadobacter frigoris]
MEDLDLIEKSAHCFQAIQVESAQFRVAAIGENKCKLTSYNRRDFYKITLVLKGKSQLLYANRDIEINKPALVFTNPLVPYSWGSSDGEEYEEAGYFCVFSNDFLHAGDRMGSLQESTLFKAGGNPVYLLDEEQLKYISSLFIRMRSEIDSEYYFKYELIRSQLNLLIHEAIKMQPAVAYPAPQNAASRIAKLFIGLLEKQFPVDSPQRPLQLKKAGDYAEKLTVHVNHLNAAVQEITGKSTTTHINERIISEAKSLLKHTDWSVAEIAFCLGFEYASYFNNFFKKHAGVTPAGIRNN